jgi:type II secretory ATPase GspE/PulE/Tfp pilus assembly ATPase PilB-like protein
MTAPKNPTPDARVSVDDILLQAVTRRASDVHLEPTTDGYEIRLRVDGVLTTLSRCDAATGRSVVGRLMVLAHLLTYRVDVPQEGRLTVPRQDDAKTPPLDLRLSVIPTTHGLRAAVRLPAELIQPHSLSELGLPPGVTEGLHRFARTDAGMLLVTGPAGAGKTTTIYALLRHIVESDPGLSVVALEDPVERDVPGVTQIQVQPFGELTYERTLRSILRQDPQVLMLGEIRDAATASLALQAALSGHRLVCTLHAATCGGAVARLLEMGCEPYQITSALFGVLAQRLLRRKSGGRVPVAEVAYADEPTRKAILARSDASTLQEIFARQQGYRAMRDVANDLVVQGVVNAVEADRAVARS